MTRRACGAALQVTVVGDAREIWGSERSILRLAPSLGSLGIELSLASPPDSAFARAWSALGLRHVALNLPAQAGLRARGGSGYRSARDLLAEAVSLVQATVTIARATRDAEVVHSNNILVHPSCALAGRITRRPTVLEYHDIIEPGLGQRLLTGSTLLASSAMAISEATARCVAPVARRRVRMVPQAVDTDAFTTGQADPALRTRLGGSDSSPLIGIVGRVDPEKGILDLVRAVGLLGADRPGRDARLVVVGAPGLDDGSYLNRVLEAGQNILGDRFRFAGTVEDIPAVMRCLDVLVNASYAEPFGLTLLEAQACGVPVVAASAGGIPDFVIDRKTGLLFPPGDSRLLADALSAVLGDPALRDRLVRGALASIAADYSIRARADKVAAIYRSAAGGKRSGAG